MIVPLGAPTDLAGCLLWLDAQDSASVIRDGSNVVSQWSDKSGNANHATQSTDNNKPVYSAAGFGGLPALDWGAGAVAAKGLTTPSITYGVFTVFFVAQANSGSVYIYTHESNSAANREYLLGDPNPNYAVRRGSGQSAKQITPLFGAVGEFLRDGRRHIITRTFNGTHATNNVRQDGAYQQAPYYSSTSNASDPGTTTSAGPVYIGNSNLADNPHRGYIAEVIIFNRCLNDGEIALVEMYLSRKWRVAVQMQRLIASPLELSDLAMWYDASQGVTFDVNGVSQWNDSSGNARHLTQSVDANKPTYNPSNEAYGGKPTVDWDTAANGDRLNRGLETIAQPLTIFACANIANEGSSNIALFDNGTSTEFGIGRQNGTSWYMFATATTFPTPAVGTKPFVLTMQHHAAVSPISRARFNGQTVVNVNTAAAINITNFRLGCFVDPFLTGNWVGSIAEFLVYRRRMVEGEITAVEAYLRRKYAL